MRAFLFLVCITLLTACGFQLRGNYALPFDTLHIALPENSPLRAVLKRTIESSSKTKVVDIDNAASAQAVLTIISDREDKSILSLSGGGRVREFQLIRQFIFRVHAPDGRDYIPYSEIVLRRDLGYSDATVLARESEENLLRKDMQTDLVQQLLRRLAAAKMTAAPAAAPAANATAP